jgi:hypothetical protein
VKKLVTFKLELVPFFINLFKLLFSSCQSIYWVVRLKVFYSHQLMDIIVLCSLYKVMKFIVDVLQQSIIVLFHIQASLNHQVFCQQNSIPLFFLCYYISFLRKSFWWCAIWPWFFVISLQMFGKYCV